MDLRELVSDIFLADLGGSEGLLSSFHLHSSELFGPHLVKACLRRELCGRWLGMLRNVSMELLQEGEIA